MRRTRTVLWGARRGDLQYGGLAWRRRNIPIGASVVQVDSTLHFAPGDTVTVYRQPLHHSLNGPRLRIVGIEPGRLGVELVPTTATD